MLISKTRKLALIVLELAFELHKIYIVLPILGTNFSENKILYICPNLYRNDICTVYLTVLYIKIYTDFGFNISSWFSFSSRHQEK